MAGKWDAYLKLGDLTGGSQRAGHEGEIEITTFSFGGYNPTSVGQGKGGGVGMVALSEFEVSKRTDASSAHIFQRMCDGTHFPEAKLTLYKAGGGSAVDYLIFEFQEVRVSSYQVAGDEESGIPLENIAFAFGSVKFTFHEQDETGAKTGAHVGGWDVRTRQPAA